MGVIRRAAREADTGRDSESNHDTPDAEPDDIAFTTIEGDDVDLGNGVVWFVTPAPIYAANEVRKKWEKRLTE